MVWVYLVACVLCSISWVVGVLLDWDFLDVLPINLGIAFVVFVVWLVHRRMRARAAAALEKSILGGADRQAQNVRPDRRGEIAQMQDEMKKGFDVLRNLKDGGRALATLPWYVIVGPPGAGKTTALRQSGLDFPMQRDGRAATRGVGGTRNCEWWFSNEAVLLDTAGRWAVEQDDREEWLAFLDTVKKFRSRTPINGVVVAVSIADLVRLREEQIEELAKALRARVDELMVRLQIVVPVYLLFTKADLIGGFVEFFGDLKRSERGQIWGATFPRTLDLSRGTTPAIEAEFDLLAQTLHARTLVRVRTERARELRPAILRFPLEFRQLRPAVSFFATVLMRQNMYQETPIFRGFYFTSGTQEGRPMDLVLGSMAQAFGLAAPQSGALGPQGGELKSYFLTDVFRKAAFPDQDLAARRKFLRRGP